MNLSFERDESLYLKTQRRTEKRCDPIFFTHVSFHAFVCDAETHGLRNKIKVFLRDEFKFCDKSLHLKTHKRTEKRCDPNFLI